MSTILGVNAAIFNEHGQILLTLREDFEVWCMPGGGVDDGESPCVAVAREAEEETGLKVRPARFVGLYTRPSWMHLTPHIAVFVCKVVGGALKPDPHEVLTIGYFDPFNLPNSMMLGQVNKIQDAVRGLCGTVVTEQVDFPLPQVRNRAELYAARDASGLSRRDFYMRTFPPLQPGQIIRHLNG
ncbi:MAG: NUDIX domain-containing protein [Anaerolineae bacterium]|nr:NUDIX domain-containing protein [Anaerolineae bacterium]